MASTWPQHQLSWPASDQVCDRQAPDKKSLSGDTVTTARWRGLERFYCSSAWQVLTSHIKRGLAVECVVLAKVVHGHRAAAINGEVNHLVKGDELDSVELPIVDGLSAERRRG